MTREQVSNKAAAYVDTSNAKEACSSIDACPTDMMSVPCNETARAMMQRASYGLGRSGH